MSIFEVRNFTYYVTEDLERLLVNIEAWMTTQGITVAPASVRNKADIGRVLSFRDYKPQSLSSKDKLHVGSRVDHTRGFGSHRNRFVKMSGYQASSPTIRMVPPAMLFPVPLEALAVAGDTVGRPIPQDASCQLVERLLDCYQGLKWKSVPYKSVQAMASPVRIASTCASIGVEERERAANELAQQRWVEVAYDAEKLVEYSTRLVSTLARGEKGLKRAKVEVTPSAERLISLGIEVRELVNALDICNKQVLRDYAPSGNKERA